MAGQLYRLTTAELSTWASAWGDWALNTQTNEIHIGIPGVQGGLQIGGVSAGASTILGMLDTPADYAGFGGNVLKVAGAEDGIEFGTLSFSELFDTPTPQAGDENKLWGVSADLSGFQLVDPPVGSGGGATEFLQLTDTPASYGAPGLWYRVKSTGLSLESFVPRWHEMTNVDVANATNFQVPRFETATNTWKAHTPTVPTFLGLPDVPNAVGSALQVFRTNALASGMEWGDFDLAGLSDLVITNPQTNDTIVRQSNGTWINSPPSNSGDIFANAAAWAAATLQLTLQDNDVGSPDIVVTLTHATEAHSDWSAAGRGIGSLAWFDGAGYVHLPAPTGRQGIAWNPTPESWELEELLILDMDADLSQGLVADAYAAGSTLAAEGDSYNVVPPGTLGQQYEVGAGNLPGWVDKVPMPARRFADRATAAAASWVGYTFPTLMLLDSDTFNGVTGFKDTPAAYVLLEAPTGTVDPTKEIAIGPRWFDEDGKWVGDISPFPGTHALTNILVRNAHCAMFASASGATPGQDAFQAWLPQQTILLSTIIPKADIATGTSLTARYQAMITGQATRWTYQSVEGNSVAKVDLTLMNDADDTAFTNELQMPSAAAAAPAEIGLGAFLTGFGGSTGLIRENDRFYAKFGATADNTHDLQLLVYGFDLTPTGLRS